MISLTPTNGKMVAKVLTLLYASTFIPKVWGHGYIESATVNGYTWPGFDEPHWTKPSGSAILVTDYLVPTYDVWSRDIACGINPQAAQNVATVSPGDQIWWKWVTHSGANAKTWTHNEGTHRTFIGPCIGDCGSTDPTQVQWTELSSQYTGQQTWDGSRWPVATLASGNAWSDSIPPAPNGDYLIRNELTALHYSTSPYNNYDGSVGHGWGTEFYVTCMAIRIQNSGGNWDMSSAVTFPGAYTVDEAGHYNPNLWTDPSSVVISALNTFTRSGSGNSSGNNSNNNSNSGNNNNNNNGNSSGGNSNPPASPSSSTVTPTISNPVCHNRRKRSLSGPSTLMRRHYHRQARRVTG